MSQGGAKRNPAGRGRYDPAMKRLLTVAVLLAVACGRAPAPVPPAPSPSPVPTSPPPPAVAPYVPDLGAMMGMQQMRHVKLGLAGDAGNWKLAAYELGELKDGFDEIVQYHKTHKESPVPIDEAVETIMKEPMSELAKAIEKKDKAEFRKTYDTVTDGCNACHQATNYGFLVIVRPKSNPYPNQSFAPPR
jgi:hypothetical protein